MPFNFDKFEMFGLSFRPETFVQSEPTTPHVRCRISFLFFVLLLLADYEGWKFPAVYLCTVTGHCTAIGIFAEIYNIVSDVFFQCFPHNIW